MIPANPRIIYPVGIQSFSKLREEGYLYVDKTAAIFRLITSGSYFFLSRPRRFGKSLLLSTIDALFQGRRDLFEGLAIDSMPHDWDAHPVFHLDLNVRNYADESSLATLLNRHLDEWEQKYRIITSSMIPEDRFVAIIKKAYEATGKRVVILVDEYDKPLLHTIGNPQLHDIYLNQLQAFYGVLKSLDSYIRFAMLTGVSRFSKVSIFSGLNNLRDISFERDYSTICGITPHELATNFISGIDSLAHEYGLTPSSVVDTLKQWYDGYHFATDLRDVYNPFSLVNVFAAKAFGNYWFDSGTPTYLVELLKRNPLNLQEISGFKTRQGTLAAASIQTGNSIVAMFQAGYLTISGYDSTSGMVTLDYPNREVKESLLSFLIPYYTGIREIETDFAINRFADEVDQGNPEAFMTRLASLVDHIPYGGKGVAPEDHFQNAIYLVFSLLGYRARVEQRMARGRIDLSVESADYIYLFEFKVDRSANEAMEQMRGRAYWKGFLASGKKIFLIAANFRSSTRTLDDCIIEPISHD
jgi:hypothetical protein